MPSSERPLRHCSRTITSAFSRLVIVAYSCKRAIGRQGELSQTQSREPSHSDIAPNDAGREVGQQRSEPTSHMACMKWKMRFLHRVADLI